MAAEKTQEAKDVVAGLEGFAGVMKDMHAKLPAPSTFTADQPCPPEVGKTDGKRNNLTMLDRDLVELFATDGASWKQRSRDPSALRPASEAMFSDLVFEEFRTAYFGTKEVRDRLSRVNPSAFVYSVYNGNAVTRPYVGVFVATETRFATLVDSGTFTGGKIDGWIVVWDTAKHGVACQARVTAINTPEMSYREHSNPQGALDGDLESNFQDAAVIALDKIASGSIIYYRGVKDGKVVKWSEL